MKDLNLAGDILDANISPLARAIAGEKGSGKWPMQMGFRHWQLIFSKMARSILVTPTNRGKQTQESLGLTKQSDQLERTPNRILDFRGIDSSGGRTPCQHVR